MVRSQYIQSSVGLIMLLLALPGLVFAQSTFTSTNFELNVNGFGEAGVGVANSANFSVVSKEGPDLTLNTTTPPVVVSPPSGGGGGSSSPPPDRDPETDNGIAIRSIVVNGTTANFVGELLRGTEISPYFVLSKTNDTLNCVDPDLRYNVVGTFDEGDVFDYGIAGLDAGSRYYVRLCGANKNARLIGASAVESFFTLGEVFPPAPGDEVTPPTPETPGSEDGEGSAPVDGGPADEAGEGEGDGTPDSSLGGRDSFVDLEEEFPGASAIQLEEHGIPYVNNGELFSVSKVFDDRSSITIVIWPDSILDANGNPVPEDLILRVIITEYDLDNPLYPDRDLNAISVNGTVYGVRVVDQFGNEYDKFDPDLMVEIAIRWPENERPEFIPDNLNLYYLEWGDPGWTRIPGAIFDGTNVLFLLDHLTLFGVWGVSGGPSFMPLDTGREADAFGQGVVATQCLILFGFLPWCWPWFALYIALAFIASFYLYLWYVRRKEAKKPKRGRPRKKKKSFMTLWIDK